MAEHQIVDLAVEGSNPSSHPNLSIRFVYTERVDDRPIVWDAANRRHLGSDHPERRLSTSRDRRSASRRGSNRDRTSPSTSESSDRPDLGGPVARSDVGRSPRGSLSNP